jgi:hypothetical protein
MPHPAAFLRRIRSTCRTQRRSCVGSALGDRIASGLDHAEVAVPECEHRAFREGDDQVVVLIGLGEDLRGKLETEQHPLRKASPPALESLLVKRVEELRGNLQIPCVLVDALTGRLGREDIDPCEVHPRRVETSDTAAELFVPLFGNGRTVHRHSVESGSGCESGRFRGEYRCDSNDALRIPGIPSDSNSRTPPEHGRWWFRLRE